MSAPRPRPSIDVLAALLAVSLLATGAVAQTPAAPAPTVQPPPRPAELTSRPAPTPTAADTPVPPQRPAELAPGAPNTDIVAAPLPPDRPAELREVTTPANPGAVLDDAPQPPPRPPELAGSKPAQPTAEPPDAPLPPGRPPEPSEAKTPANPEAVLSAAPPPPSRPPELSGGTPLAITVAPHDMPLPPERPVEFGPSANPVEAAPMPPARPAELTGPSIASQLLDAPEDTVCLRNLEALGVTYKKLAPIVNGQCSVAHPLDIEALSEGIGMNSIAVTADQMVVCSVAEGLGRWAKDAQAAAEKELGDRLKGLTLGGGYHCRGQNNVGQARLSEHAFANAMDIMGFTFAKHAPIAVSFLPEGSPEAKFVDSVRASACKYFRTVLGPGSNEAHANHLHFDQRQREGGHRLCELRPAEAAAAPGTSAQAKP